MPALGVYTSNGGFSTSIATSTGIATQATGSSFAAWIVSDGSITAFSDTFSNIWVQQVTNGHAPNFQRYANLWTCANGSGGSAHKLNATQTGGSAYAIAFVEITSATTLDQVASTNNDSFTNTVSFPSVTTTQAAEVLLEFTGCPGSANTYSSLTAGFSPLLQQVDGNGEEEIYIAYQVLSSTGTFAPTVTKSGNQPYWAAAASFYASAGGISVAWVYA